MRTFALFVLFFLPMAAAMLHYGALAAQPKELPSESPSADTPGVLKSDDLVGEGATAPFQGKIIRLNDLELKVIDEDYVKYYVRLGRLARKDGKPRLEEVFCALFDPPENEQPKLRVTIESPFVEGDPAQLLAPEGADAPRIVSLGGGVVVRDPQGRELASVDRLAVDLANKTATSDQAVVLRFPGRGTLHATGLFADFDKNLARLERDVTARVTIDEDTAKLGCKGPATLVRDEKRGIVTVTLTGGAWLEHPLLRAACDRIEATLVRTEGKEQAFRATRVVLSGGVVVTLDAQHARGVETLHVPRLVLDLAKEGHERIVFDGEVTAVRKGAVEALGLGDREIDIRAGGGTLVLQPTDKENGREPKELRFTGGFEARDRHGAGYLKAGAVTYSHADKKLEAHDGVEGKTADGFVKADSLRLVEKGPEHYEVHVEGEGKRIEYVADGKLGPLGEGRRGRLVLEATGPIDVTRNKKSIAFTAKDDVRASLGEGATLRCGNLEIKAEDKKVTLVRATGTFALDDAEHKIKMRGRSLVYKEAHGVLEGDALVEQDGRSVRAQKLTYNEDGAFAADGDVVVRAALNEGGGAWTFRCGKASGVMGDGKTAPESLEVSGSLVADGPEGQHVEGDSFSFDGKTGKAVLRGTPAILKRGEGLVIEAAEGFELILKDNEIADATTLGPARIDFIVPDTDEGAVRRWKIALRGPATLAGAKVLVKKGASLQGYDKDGKLLIDGSVNRVAVELTRDKDGTWAPRSFVGDKGVRVVGHGERAATVTAKSLSFVVGTRRVDVRGSARVTAKGWAPEVTFEHVVFTLEEDGVDLKRASRISVKDRKK